MQAIVIDLGVKRIKAGFSNEEKPRKVFTYAKKENIDSKKTEQKRDSTSIWSFQDGIILEQSPIQLKSILKEIFIEIFFK